MILKLSDTISRRQARDEVVVVDFESGGIFYFTKESEDFFDFFSKPRRLEDFTSRVSNDPDEIPANEYLDQFVDFLKINSIVETVALADSDVEHSKTPLPRPVFLRQTAYDNRMTANMSLTATGGLGLPALSLCPGVPN